jgi:hypothetical protein
MGLTNCEARTRSSNCAAIGVYANIESDDGGCINPRIGHWHARAGGSVLPHLVRRRGGSFSTWNYVGSICNNAAARLTAVTKMYLRRMNALM